MKSVIQSVKGTRDFYPEDMVLRSWLYRTLRSVSEEYGYQEYEGPILERLELYAAKSGEELVKEQAFVFEDRGGSEITLRPELTPTLARMVAQQQNTLTFPLRWWSFGPFWRYERPQKGRTREFFQWNIDLIGSSGPEADAELLAICASLFKKVGLSPHQAGIMVNNRRLMDSALQGINIRDDQHGNVFHLIDRKDKQTAAEWNAYGLEMGLAQVQIDGLNEILLNQDLWLQSEELVRIFTLLESMGMQDYFHFNPQVVRGLDYYTGTVFEARDMDREGRAILGGGRYDNLVSAVGGDPLPGVGFAMGDVMFTLILQKYGLIPSLNPQTARILMTVFDKDSFNVSYAAAADLRGEGLAVICYPEPAKLQKQFKYADRLGANIVLVIGPDEAAAGAVTVKDLFSHTQQTIFRAELAGFLKKLLAQA